MDTKGIMKPEAEKGATCLYCGKPGIVPKPTHLLVMDARACGHEFAPSPSQAPPEKPLESERDQKAAIPDLDRLEYLARGGFLFTEKEMLPVLAELKMLRAERDQLRMERDAAWNEAIDAAASKADDFEGDPDAIPAIRSLARPIPAEPREGQ